MKANWNIIIIELRIISENDNCKIRCLVRDLKKVQIIETIHDIDVDIYSAIVWQRNNKNVNQGCEYLNLKVKILLYYVLKQDILFSFTRIQLKIVFWDQESVPYCTTEDEISKPICKWYLEELFFIQNQKLQEKTK